MALNHILMNARWDGKWCLTVDTGCPWFLCRTLGEEAETFCGVWLDGNRHAGIGNIWCHQNQDRNEHIHDKEDIQSGIGMMLQTAPSSEYQEMGECCGFEGYEDRVQEPCTEYVERLGCWEQSSDPHTHAY